MDEALAIPGTRACGVPELTLRRLAAGELDAEAERQIRGHLADCARCAKAFSRMEREAQAFFASVPLEPFALAVKAKLRVQERRRWAGPAALALAAALALGLLASPLQAVLNGPSHGNRSKGDLLDVYVGGAGAPRIAQNGEALAPGERIRLGYHGAEGGYLLVLSLDESGEVTPLYPEQGRSLKAEPGNQVHMLPESVELTGRGLERLVMLFSDQPLEVEAAREAARAEFSRARSLAAMAPLPLDAREQSLLLRKP